jgi:hypothetical protein
MKKSSESDFWAKFEVAPDGCWNWQGSLLRTGYGQVKYQGKQLLAHRLSAYLSGILSTLDKQSVGAGGKLVCHRCDNKKCGNPKHLYLGSAATNFADAKARGLLNPRSGERHHAARLSESEVRAIRTSNDSAKVLSSKYGVTDRTIRKIKAGSRWTNLTDK